MRNIIIFLLLAACSTAPKIPTISTGHPVQKRLYYKVEGAGDVLRNTPEATIAAWIKPYTAPTGNEDIFNISVGGNSEEWKTRAGFRVIPGGAFQSITRARDQEELSEIITVPGLLRVNQWQHVALTIDYANKKMQFFVDGKPVETSQSLFNFSDPRTSDTPSHRVTLGAEDDGQNSFFNGEIAGAYVDKRVLSETEIRQEMKRSGHP